MYLVNRVLETNPKKSFTTPFLITLEVIGQFSPLERRVNFSVPEVLCVTAIGSLKLPTFYAAKAEDTPRKSGSVPQSSQFLCSPEQSNDDLVMEVLSDIMAQLPLTVENEEAPGTESQCTFKFIVSSPIWERRQNNIQGG